MEKLKRKRSALWQFFTPIDALQANCDVCKQIVSYKSSVTNLKSHLSRKHPTISLAQPACTSPPAFNEPQASPSRDKGNLCTEDPDEAAGPCSASTSSVELLSLSGGGKKKKMPKQSKEQDVSMGASIIDTDLKTIIQVVGNPAVQQERLLCQFLADGWSKIQSPTIKKELRRQWITSLLEAEAKDEKEDSDS